MRVQFRGEIDGIEGELNKRGGGFASLSSGSFVVTFADKIEAELLKRSEIARKALGNALQLQDFHLDAILTPQLKSDLKAVWDAETNDLYGWYQKRVQNAQSEKAEQRPFKVSADKAFMNIFVDLENKALAFGSSDRHSEQEVNMGNLPILKDATRVAVVHGRNDKARNSMFALLRALDLKPLEFTEAILFLKRVPILAPFWRRYLVSRRPS